MTLRPFLDILLHVLVFLMGAGIGSFLNVVIYRVPLGISVNNPKRSYCFSCKKQIPWYHNLPLISWLVLRGKCANCGSRIAFRYFFVELLTACLLYAVFRHFSGEYVHGPWEQIRIWGPVVLIFWIFTALLVSGTFIDIDHYILPHSITIGGLSVGLIASFWQPLMMGETSHWSGLLMSLLGAATGLGLLWAVVELGKLAFGRIKQNFEKPESWSISQSNENEPPVFKIGDTVLTWHDIYTRPSDRLIIQSTSLTVNDRQFTDVKVEIKQHAMKVIAPSGEESFKLENVKVLSGGATEIVIPREAMGFGDVLLLAMIGSFLGWKAVLFTILAASVLGTLIALGPRLIGKTEWGTKLPFGPYLAGGAMIWLFWGPQILHWYLGRLHWQSS